MRFFDLSQPVFDQCPNCPAHPPVRIELASRHPQDGWQLEMLSLATHTGTHLDAPLHKLAGGKSIDALPLEAFSGRVVVADFSGSEAGQALDEAGLQARLPGDLGGAIVLLNTGWGLRRAVTDEWLKHSPFLSPAGARWLVASGIKGVGIDHFSIGGLGEPDNARTHEILLGAAIWIVEELRFTPGWREFLPGAWFQALPIFLQNSSGAPCRAVLVRNEGGTP